MSVYQWLGVQLRTGGMNMFSPRNNMVMIDDGHLIGWPRTVDDATIDRRRLNPAALEKFDPAAGLDRFGFTGERMAGKLILLNFERTAGWSQFGPWFAKVAAEVIARVNAVDADQSPLFYLYDWSDTIEDGVRYADGHVDGRFIPIGSAWGRDPSDPVAWLRRFSRSIVQKRDLPMIQPLEPDMPLDRVEKFMLLAAPLTRHLAIWGVTSEETEGQSRSTFNRCAALWTEMQHELEVSGHWDRVTDMLYEGAPAVPAKASDDIATGGAR